MRMVMMFGTVLKFRTKCPLMKLKEAMARSAVDL
jgi:hypothetical protein